MVDRFKVVDIEEAAEYDEEAAEDMNNSWYEYCSYLLDTKTGTIVFNDRMEPEDASLDRDLRPLVKLLNQVATEKP